jgi:hypothetical protein
VTPKRVAAMAQRGYAASFQFPDCRLPPWWRRSRRVWPACRAPLGAGRPDLALHQKGCYSRKGQSQATADSRVALRGVSGSLTFSTSRVCRCQT